MRRLSLVLVAVLAAPWVLAPALAAGLGGIASDDLGAGDAAITPCDPDGVTVSFTVASGDVTHVNVSGIAVPDCDGELLQVTVADTSGASIGSGSITIGAPGDGDETVAVSPQPSHVSADTVHVAITG